MAAFRFRLETLLNVRSATRDGCRAHLAEMLAREQVLIAQQAAREHELDDVRGKRATNRAPRTTNRRTAGDGSLRTRPP